MSWEKTKLKDLGWLRSAGVNKLSDSNQKEVQLLNYMDVYRNQKISNEIDFQIVTAKDAEIKNANLEVGDILFTPSSEKPTDIGHAGVIIEELENTVYSYHLVRFRPDEPKKFNPHFLAYALNSFSSEKHFISRATGTTRYTLSKSDFQSLEFEYPENPKEQTAIATILSKVDEAIAATRQSINAAEKLKKALMQNLLTGKLKPDGTWRNDDEFYEDEKFGKVPVGWEIKKGKKIFKSFGSSTFDKINISKHGNCLYMKVSDFNLEGNEFYIEKANIMFSYENNERLKYCESGFIVVSKRGEAIRKNRVRILAKRTLLDPNLMALKIIDGNPLFFKFLLQEMNLQRFLENSALPQLNNKDFYPRNFLYPPIGEQDNISAILIEQYKIIKSKQTKIQTLQRLKKSLMQNLLTGKVRIDVEAINKIISE